MTTKTKATFLIIFFVLFYGIHNYFWLNNTVNFPARQNEAVVYFQVVDWVTALKSGNLSSIQSFLTGFYNTPLYILPAAVVTILCNAGYHFHVMLNVGYFLLCLMAIYLLARIVFDDHTALLTVCLLSLYPGVYSLSRHFFIEFGLLWSTALTVYFLIKSEYFYSRKYSIYVGIIVGVGLMTKITYAVFIMPVLCYYIIISFIKNNSRRKALCINVLVVVCLSSLIAGYKYFRIDLIRFLLFNFVSEPDPEPVTKYIVALKNIALSFPFFIIFCLSFVWMILYEKKDTKWLLVLLFVPAFLYHSFMMRAKQIRFVLPLLPVIAIMSARLLSKIPFKKIRLLCISSLLLYGFIQYYVIFFNTHMIVEKFPFTYCVDYRHPLFNRSLSKDNIHNKIIDNLVSCGIRFTEEYQFFFLPAIDQQAAYSLFAPTIWKIIPGATSVPFQIEIHVDSHDIIVKAIEGITRADAVVYLDTDDGHGHLMNDDNLAMYMESLIEKTFTFVDEHPELFSSYQCLDFLATPELQNEVKAQFKNKFSHFTLFKIFKQTLHGTEYKFYIYTRRQR